MPGGRVFKAKLAPKEKLTKLGLIRKFRSRRFHKNNSWCQARPYRVNEGPPGAADDDVLQAVELVAAAESGAQLADRPVKASTVAIDIAIDMLSILLSILLSITRYGYQTLPKNQLKTRAMFFKNTKNQKSIIKPFL
jgi:hypothetical protein